MKPLLMDSGKQKEDLNPTSTSSALRGSIWIKSCLNRISFTLFPHILTLSPVFPKDCLSHALSASLVFFSLFFFEETLDFSWPGAFFTTSIGVGFPHAKVLSWLWSRADSRNKTRIGAWSLQPGVRYSAQEAWSFWIHSGLTKARSSLPMMRLAPPDWLLQ